MKKLLSLILKLLVKAACLPLIILITAAQLILSALSSIGAFLLGALNIIMVVLILYLFFVDQNTAKAMKALWIFVIEAGLGLIAAGLIFGIQRMKELLGRVMCW